MAGNLHVRNLDDDLIARLKRRAARQVGAPQKLIIARSFVSLWAVHRG